MHITGSGAPRTSGEFEISKISGETIIAKISGETVISKISGETVIAKVSGETIVARVSGETVVGKISGETIKLAIPSSVITGQAVISGTNLSGATPIQIGSAVCVRVIVKAFPNNSGNIYIGKDDVSSNVGFVLAPGDSVTIDIDNVNKLYATSDIDGDKVCWIALQE